MDCLGARDSGLSHGIRRHHRFVEREKKRQMEINKQRHQTELFNYLFNNELMVNLSKYEMAIRQWLPETGGKQFFEFSEIELKF